MTLNTSYAFDPLNDVNFVAGIVEFISPQLRLAFYYELVDEAHQGGGHIDTAPKHSFRSISSSPNVNADDPSCISIKKSDIAFIYGF